MMWERFDSTMKQRSSGAPLACHSRRLHTTCVAGRNEERKRVRVVSPGVMVPVLLVTLLVCKSHIYVTSGFVVPTSTYGGDGQHSHHVVIPLRRCKATTKSTMTGPTEWKLLKRQSSSLVVVATELGTMENSVQRRRWWRSPLGRVALRFLLVFGTVTMGNVLIPYSAVASSSSAAAASLSMTTTTTADVVAAALPVPLGWSNVVRASSILFATAGIGLWGLAGFPSTARAVLMSWLRSATQLYWFGGLLLTHLLTIGQTRPWLVLGWIGFTAAVAAQEAMTRVEHTYPALVRHMLTAVSAGAGSILFATMALRILGPVEPWFAPRTWIPLSGMILGNALTGTALAAKTVTKELAINRDQIELRLSQGAHWKEALSPVLQTVYTTSLTPIMNFLSAAGIVHIPGLMTGQILAGQAPLQAATYQVVIFAMMASCVCMTVQLVTHLAVSTLVDQPNDRLRLASLTPIDNRRKRKKREYLPSTLRIVPQFCSAVKKQIQRLMDQTEHRGVTRYPKLKDSITDPSAPAYSVSMFRSPFDASIDTSPILSVQNMRIARTQMDITFDVRHSDRIGLVGPSGIGKSQVLKTLAGLEPVNRSALEVLDRSATRMSMAEWRSHVLLVPQERPSLEGTPHQFFTQVTSFASQKAKMKQWRSQSDGTTSLPSPVEYGAEWGLAPRCFDQPWSTLSGGESQRALLAIALALQPHVLLLDESTSALDDRTARLVEMTLERLRMPVIMVSHSAAQVNRFCTHRINLERGAAATNIEIEMNAFQ